jgi:DNA-binding SARP family transcriptional activator
MPAHLEWIAETGFSEFEQKIQGKPLIIIYPRHRSRSALVAMFLHYYSQNIIYYSLDEHDTALASWLNHMVNSDRFPSTFGNQTRAALAAKSSPEDLAAAVGDDLAAWSPDRFMLLLDSFDWLEPSEAVDRFFSALPSRMPPQAQIVINARLLDVKPWNGLLHAGQVEVVGNDEAVAGGIYGEDESLGQLEVFALSGGHVYSDGRPVTSWDGSLPRHLFYYFVDHPMVTRDEIFDIFWPKMPVKEATNVFHVTKRKISERLGHELTSYSGGFYMPSPRLSVHYDVRVFEDSIEQAIENEQDAPGYWYQAVQLYRSDFLPGIHTPWVETRREVLKNKYAQALIGLGRYHRGLNELDKALGYLLRALQQKPDWEDVHQDVMMIYYQQGRRDEAIAQYRQLERTLVQMFGIKPGKDTRHLYDVISAV